MDELEDALEPRIEDGGFATLAMVSTGEGIREWAYYAQSGDAFVKRLNAALGQLRRFPIEIHVARDAEWSYYTNFVASVLSEPRGSSKPRGSGH